MVRPYPTTPDLIKAEIERMHARNTGDWQSLVGQVDNSYKQITYNLAQMFALSIPTTAKALDLEWGRGTGKTTVFARFTRVIAQEMPRASYQWIVPNYQKFLTEIIPSYIHALEMQGLYKDLHYFIGRKPPASWKWPEPYKPPVRYDNFITFWNGFGMHLLSQDVAGSGRGLNTDGEFADETAMLSWALMEENSNPALRGSNVAALGEKRWFDFRLKATSTPITQSGVWFTNREEMAQLDPHLHRFLKANCLCNMHNLKPDYLEEARRTASDKVIFEAEYLNIRPRFVRGGFYALLDEARHAYSVFRSEMYASMNLGAPDCRGDEDLTPGLPLYLGQDFGAAINSLTVSQYLPGPHEFRTLKDFFAKGADGGTQDDVAEAFHTYYLPHQAKNKVVYLWYDATGNHATGHTKLTKAQQMEKYLREHGWVVQRCTIQGTNPRHFEKQRLWEQILNESDKKFPKFRINKVNAKHTFLSMLYAKSKRGTNGEIKKDKSGERVTNKQRELATDLSDAVDNPVFGQFAHLLQDYGASLPK